MADVNILLNGNVPDEDGPFKGSKEFPKSSGGGNKKKGNGSGGGKRGQLGGGANESEESTPRREEQQQRPPEQDPLSVANGKSQFFEQRTATATPERNSAAGFGPESKTTATSRVLQENTRPRPKSKPASGPRPKSWSAVPQGVTAEAPFKARPVENLEQTSKDPTAARSALFQRLVGVGDLTARSVILQPDASPFVRGVNLGEAISPPRQHKSGARVGGGGGVRKSVYRAKTFTGANLLLKYYPLDLERNYLREVAAYEALEGCTVIPEYLGSGPVQLSSVLASGFCILMAEVPGVTLTAEKLKEMGPAGREAFRAKLEGSYSEIRKRGFVCFDPRPENILLDEIAGQVTIVDLELCIKDTAYEGYEVEQVLREPWPGFFIE